MKTREYNKKVFKINFIILVVFIIIVTIFFIIDINKSNELRERLKTEYPDLLKEDKIDNSTIKSSYYPEDWRAGSIYRFVTLENNKKYSIEIDKKLSAKCPDFGEIVQKGVVLDKNKGSDTLVVKDGSKEYLYLINR